MKIIRPKNISLGVLLVLTFATLCHDTFAQRKPLTSVEFFRGVFDTGRFDEEKPQRVVENTEKLLNGTVTKTATSIYERESADRYRNYSKVIDGDTMTETDVITLGNFRYTKKNGGAWSKMDLSKGGYGTGNGSGNGSYSCDQFTVDTVLLNGMNVKLFESLRIRSNNTELLFQEERYWVGEDGARHRIEKTGGKVSPREETSRMVTTFEYNPDLKIEAPIK